MNSIINYPIHLFKSIYLGTCLFVFFVLLSLNACQNNQNPPKIEKGSCVAVPFVQNCSCTWEKRTYEHKLSKVTIVQDSFTLERYSKDSVITEYINEKVHRSSYLTNDKEGDSTFSTSVEMANTGQLISSYKEEFSSINGVWKLSTKKNVEADSLNKNRVEWTNRYVDGLISDSVAMHRQGDNELTSMFTFSNNKRQLYRWDSLVYQKDALVASVFKRYQMFDAQQPLDFYGLWSDSTIGKIESYSERRTSNDTIIFIRLEYFPDVDRSYWEMDVIQKIYQPLLDKIEKKYLRGENNIEYNCIMNVDQDLCYERYMINHQQKTVRKRLRSLVEMLCNEGKTLAKVYINYRIKEEL